MGTPPISHGIQFYYAWWYAGGRGDVDFSNISVLTFWRNDPRRWQLESHLLQLVLSPQIDSHLISDGVNSTAFPICKMK